MYGIHWKLKKKEKKKIYRIEKNANIITNDYFEIFSVRNLYVTHKILFLHLKERITNEKCHVDIHTYVLRIISIRFHSPQTFT